MNEFDDYKSELLDLFTPVMMLDEYCPHRGPESVWVLKDSTIRILNNELYNE